MGGGAASPPATTKEHPATSSPRVTEEAASTRREMDGASVLWQRLGLAIHITTPTIHAGFGGEIQLELVNYGPPADHSDTLCGRPLGFKAVLQEPS